MCMQEWLHVTIHTNHKNALPTQDDVSVAPNLGMQGALPGSSQGLGSWHPHPHPPRAHYSPDPFCLANLQPFAPSSWEGLQQSQGAGGQLAKGLIRDLGTPRGWEAEGRHGVGSSLSCLS